MGRESGRLGRFLGRLFRERQIYHRSDGIVRFIKLTSKTQMALATIGMAFLLWVAYSSVNVVFKEQIIVAKEKESRVKEATYRRKQDDLEKAYDNTQALNVILTQEFDGAMSMIESRHETLVSTYENKRSVDNSYRGHADALSANGAPGGRKAKNTNRVMVDAVGREPTPRQSRMSRLREETLQDILATNLSDGFNNIVVLDKRQRAANHSARQVVALAKVEEDVHAQREEFYEILKSTGLPVNVVLRQTAVSREMLARKEAQQIAQAEGVEAFDGSQQYVGQGGPFIAAENAYEQGKSFPIVARRVNSAIDELAVLNQAMQTLPLSKPLGVVHRVTSQFGTRRDPFTRKLAQHRGLDFRAPHKSPILTTGAGRVKFAGNKRNGYGNMVEIDHGNGIITRYAHLNRIHVKRGQKVKLHQKIGLQGSTGRSTGSHLHYEVLYKGRRLDPKSFIKAGRYVFES